MIETKRTTIKIPKDMLKAVKKIALEKETTQTNIILQFIAKGLKVEEKNTDKIKSRVINHEMLGYDPKKRGNLKNIIGIAKVDKPEDIDVQELKDSIHFKKELY